jgi:transcription-repair coupling factor (superfamily II helicase)
LSKTEVAIRAAFKAVDNSKQVVIWFYTILAYQHYHFYRTIERYAVSIGYLNRFRTAKQKPKH